MCNKNNIINFNPGLSTLIKSLSSSVVGLELDTNIMKAVNWSTKVQTLTESNVHTVYQHTYIHTHTHRPKLDTNIITCICTTLKPLYSKVMTPPNQDKIPTPKMSLLIMEVLLYQANEAIITSDKHRMNYRRYQSCHGNQQNHPRYLSKRKDN